MSVISTLMIGWRLISRRLAWLSLLFNLWFIPLLTFAFCSVLVLRSNLLSNLGSLSFVLVVFVLDEQIEQILFFLGLSAFFNLRNIFCLRINLIKNLLLRRGLRLILCHLMLFIEFEFDRALK